MKEVRHGGMIECGLGPLLQWIGVVCVCQVMVASQCMTSTWTVGMCEVLQRDGLSSCRGCTADVAVSVIQEMIMCVLLQVKALCQSHLGCVLLWPTKQQHAGHSVPVHCGNAYAAAQLPNRCCCRNNSS